MKINAEQFNALVAKLDALQLSLKGPVMAVPSPQASADRNLWLEQVAENERAKQQGEERWQEAVAKQQEEFKRLSAIEEGLQGRNEMLDGMARDMKLIFEMLGQAPSMAKVEGLQKNLNHRCDDLAGQIANVFQQQILIAKFGVKKPSQRNGKPKRGRK